MVNQLINAIAMTIPEQPGLSSLTVKYFRDKNSLEFWPLQQLVNKASSCEQLEIDYLKCKPESRALWVELAAEICVIND